MNQAALGFRVKSGWAMAVLVTGTRSSPRVVDHRRIELADPEVRGSIQPFHAGLELPKAAAAKAVGRLVKYVERHTAGSIADLLSHYRTDGYRVTGAGLVVGSTVDPETMRSAHIRAHAEEGKLFRVVIQDALNQSRLKSSVTPEKELIAKATKVLHLSQARIKTELTALGKSVGGPWSAEEKAATLAAWMILSGRVG